MNSFTITSDTTPNTWNGPTCGTCGEGWIGTHTCSREAIQRKIDGLQQLLDTLPAWDRYRPCPSAPKSPCAGDCHCVIVGIAIDSTASCPCRPENGGSGVCGCILGGPKVTC